MKNFQDLTGQKFGKLTALSKTGEKKSGGDVWLCRCDCGRTHKVATWYLINGYIKSCGCLQIDMSRKRLTKHGKTNTRLYRIYGNMKGRCYCKSRREYHNYGGRGITVCDEWLHDFQTFYDWSIANGYADNLTLDRINVNGNYEPSNCRWITNKEQQNNRQYNKLITYNGKTQTLAQWANEYNMCYKTLQKRINKWGIDKAFSEPLRDPIMCGGENPKARSVICIETGERFETVTLAAKSVKRNHTAISACCKGKTKTCGGYHWRYANE